MNFELELKPLPQFDNILNGETLAQATWIEMFGTDMFDIKTLMLRSDYTEKIGYAIWTSETINLLAHYLENKTVLDLGSGSGYSSHQLDKQGINVLAIDNDTTHKFEKMFKRDHTCNVMAFLENTTINYTDIILSWPPYEDSFGNDVLKLIKPGTTVWYIGEGSGGCCGDSDFFETLQNDFLFLDVPSKKLNETHVRFRCIHDYWQVYKKES